MLCFSELLFHWGNLRTIAKFIVRITMYPVCKLDYKLMEKISLYSYSLQIILFFKSMRMQMYEE